jgi:hypothetical protein
LLVSLVVSGVLILSAHLIGLGPAVWGVLPVAFGGALGISTQRVARSRTWMSDRLSSPAMDQTRPDMQPIERTPLDPR